MKIKRSVLTLVGAFFLALACAFGVLNYKTKASATEFVQAPSAGAIVTEGFEGFELAEKASIRLTDKKVAIKFSATVTEAFHKAHEGATYIATMNVVNSANVKALEFDEPHFENGVATLNAYLNFGNATPSVLEQALDLQFESAIYAKVGDKYYQAKNSNEVERSMRAVANDAYLNWEEGLGYERADVVELGYFTDGFRSDKEFAVVDTENTLYVHIPGAPANAAAIYVDDVKVAATYDEATDKYTVANFATAGKYITIFDVDGTAYSTNVATGATAISNLDELKATIGVAANLEGYYVLTSDIEVGTWTYVDNKLCGGTFNGLGYSLTNYVGSAHTSHYALIRESYGGTIRNLSMGSQVTMTNNAGLIIGYVMSNVAANPEKEIEAIVYPDTVLDNVVMFAQGGSNAAAINVSYHHILVKDSIFVLGRGTSAAIVYNNSGDGRITAENTIAVTAPFGKIAIYEEKVTGVDAYKTVGALYNADKEEDIVSDYQWSKLTSVKAFLPLNKENITDLLSATDGYYVVTEDIDMAEVTLRDTRKTDDNQLTYAGWGDGSRKFNGVLDGADYLLDNVYLDVVNTNAKGSYQGFISLGDNSPLITNVNLIAHSNGNRGGLFGRTKSGVINECAFKLDGSMSQNGGALFGVLDGGVTIRNSFFYNGGAYNAGYNGWFASAEAYAGSLSANNFTVVNANPKMLTAVQGKKDSDIIISQTNFNYFTSGAEYVALQENTLPENVQYAITNKICAISELNENTIAKAKVSSSGYWYLTDNFDAADFGGTVFQYSKAFKWGGAEDVTYTDYYGANIHLDGNNFALTGLDNVNGAANTAPLISEGAGSVKIENVKLEGTMDGAGSGATFLVGIIRETYGCNSISLKNVLIDVKKVGATNGALITAWSTVGTSISLDKVFVNVGTYSGPYLLVGHAWTGVITFNDVFIAGVPKGVALSKDAITCADFNGKAITPGGSGEFDGACVMAESLGALKENVTTWNKAVGLFKALDANFFTEIQA